MLCNADAASIYVACWSVFSLCHQRKFITAGNRSTYSLNILFYDFCFTLLLPFLYCCCYVNCYYLYADCCTLNIVLYVLLFILFILLVITESDRQVLIAVIGRCSLSISLCNASFMPFLVVFILFIFLFSFSFGSIWYLAGMSFFLSMHNVLVFMKFKLKMRSIDVGGGIRL